MNKKALLAVTLVLVIPVLSYFVIKYFADEVVVIPRRYYADTIYTSVSGGKETTDTLWHRVKNISLTNQVGQQVSLDDLDGKVLLLDFFFTTCPVQCPKLTRNMKKLQQAIKTRNKAGLQDSSLIQFLSLTVDPERDSVPRLGKYAEHYEINPDTWWLLTGKKKEIYDFAMNELKMGLADSGSVDADFIHSTYFVLLDKKRVVRGYYDGTDSTQLSRLAADMIYITLEKDKKKKRSLFAGN